MFTIFKNQKSKNKLIKKSSQRCFKNRNHNASVIFFDSFIISFFNDINQLIENNKNEKSEAKKLNMIILFFKIFIFFQKFK